MNFENTVLSGLVCGGIGFRPAALARNGNGRLVREVLAQHDLARGASVLGVVMGCADLPEREPFGINERLDALLHPRYRG